MDSYRLTDANMAPPRTDEHQALQPSHLENVAHKIQGAQATRSAVHKEFAPHAQEGSWGSQESDDMDCDEEEDNSQQRMGMPIAIRGGGNHVKMMPSISNGSIASTVSSGADNEHDCIPELSQSLGSTTSFDLRTPIKPAHTPLSHTNSSKSSSPQKFNFTGGAVVGATAEATATWRETLSLSPESTVATLSYDGQEQPRRASDEGRSLQQRISLSQSLGLNLNPATSSTAVTAVPGPKVEQLSGISEEGSSTSGDIAMRRISQRADGKGLGPGAAGRLTISLPPSGTSFARANMPHTPGGSAFTGARDGAATGGPPLSPFEPPTPLCMPNGPSPFGLDAPSTPANAYVAPRRPQQKRASLPHITPIRTPPAASRPAMQRNGSVGMSPLSMEFASAVSMKRSAADDAVSNSGSSSTSGRATDSQRSGTLSVSSTSSSSTLLTPPYSPLSQPQSLLDLDASSSALLERRSTSAGSSGSASKKRNVGPASISVSASGLARSLSATRPKQLKAKVSPYPMREESAAPAMQAPSPTSSTYFAVPQQRSPLAAPAAQLEPSGVPMAPRLTAPKMEKSMSAPAVPQTVSARHLQHRTLDAGFSSAYTFGDELGSGGFGFVVSATRNHDGLPVAVKFIWRDKVPTHGWVRDPHLGVVPMEAFVLKVVDHPSVVKFIELFSDDDFFYLVMELHGTPWKAPGSDDDKPAKTPAPVAKLPLPSSTPVSSGGLRSQPMQMSKSQPNALRSPSVAVFPPGSNVPQAVEADNSSVFSSSPISAPALSPKQSAALRPAPMERRSSCDLFECIEQHSRLSEDKARWVFAQVVEAVFHLDRLGITHRDIKDENCVVDADFNVKLIDFGSAVISDPRKPPPYFNRFFGTMTFASSEILQGQPYRAPQAEIWSLGVLLSILLSGECPFADPTAAIRGKISKPKGNWSPDALNLLMGCLEVNPDHRATIAQVREHPWVSCAWELRGRARPQ